MIWWKTLHRKLLSLLSWSTPLTALVLLVCLTLLLSSSAYLFVGLLTTISRALGVADSNPYAAHLPLLRASVDAADNLHGVPFLHREMNPFPIDVVYTWVNGSDPRLQRTLREFKEKMGLLTEEDKEDAQKSEEEKRILEERNSTLTQHAHTRFAESHL